MHQSILAILVGVAALGEAVAIAPPGDSVSPVPDKFSGSVLSADDDAFSVVTFLNHDLRATNAVTKDNHKRGSATDEARNHGRDDQPSDKTINKFNDKLDDSPLERIADCLNTNKEMVLEWCRCMGNCKVLKAYYHSLILTGKNDIKTGKVDNHMLADDACQTFLDGHEEPVVSQMLGMINGMNVCTPDANRRA
jgi:hypothetical protein